LAVLHQSLEEESVCETEEHRQNG